MALFLMAASAQAQVSYRYMGWGDSDANHQDLSPDCGALPDQTKLVVSITAPANVYSLEGVWGYVDFCTKPYPVPPWWTFAPYGGCRADSLSANASFSRGPFTWTDPWAGRGQTTFSFEPSPIGDWGMGRINVSVHTTPGAPIPLVAGKMYYAFQIVFGNPVQGCTGCNLGACFVLNGLVLVHDGGQEIHTEMDYTNYCRWNGPNDCPFVVATQPVTWGEIKAQYR
jgi:hypothetical protein